MNSSPEHSTAPVGREPNGGGSSESRQLGVADRDYSTRNAALDYASRGFALLPLGSRSGGRPKAPHPVLRRGWSYGENGGLPFVGQRDPAMIDQWWSTFPDSNVGIITGMPSRLLVIDCDRHGAQPSGAPSGTHSVRLGEVLAGRDGVAVFEAWAEDHGIDLAAVPSVVTPTGGGVHYYWRVERPVRMGPWMPGVDVKGDGTYVAAPPSTVGGIPYRWRRPLDTLAMAPDALLSALDGVRVGSTTGAGLDASGALPPTSEFEAHGLGWHTGSRNQDAYRLSWRLLGGPHDAAIATLYRAWQRTPQEPHPFPWSEVMRAYESAARRRAAEVIPDWRPSHDGQ